MGKQAIAKLLVAASVSSTSRLEVVEPRPLPIALQITQLVAQSGRMSVQAITKVVKLGQTATKPPGSLAICSASSQDRTQRERSQQPPHLDKSVNATVASIEHPSTSAPRSAVVTVEHTL